MNPPCDTIRRICLQQQKLSGINDSFFSPRSVAHKIRYFAQALDRFPKGHSSGRVGIIHSERGGQMAINIIEYNLIRFLRENKIFRLGGDLLEVGEANWYGDVDPNMLRSDILKFALPERQQALAAELDATLKSNRPSAPCEVARIYWETFLQPASRTAIDFHGTESALKLDLNLPIDLKRQYHVVNNCGTLEHVFNVGQARQHMRRPGRRNGLQARTKELHKDKERSMT
jgi:hypothetical protein